MKKLFKNSKTRKIVAIVLSLFIVMSCAVITATAHKQVKLKDGENELTLNTYSSSTKRILSKGGVELSHLDTVRRKEVDNTIYIEVVRAFPVHIIYHNLEHVEFVTGGTVAQVLKKAEITLCEDDVINVPETTEVYDGMKIEIDRVKYITKTDVKTVKPKTEIVKSEDYPEGYEEVTDKGANGQSEIKTTYKYVNGEYDCVSSRSEKVLKKPQAKVVLKGTAQVQQVSNIDSVTTNTSSGSSSSSGTIEGMSYSRVLTGCATAYTASSGALTSTGVPAYVGGVAVNPNVIPYGSKLYIVADGYTYGYATAVDTGGALMSGSALVDLYMSTYDECVNFGRRNVTVYVLN